MAIKPKQAEPSGSPIYVGRLAGVIYRRFADLRAANRDWHLYNSKCLPVTLERHQVLENGMTIIENLCQPLAHKRNPDLKGTICLRRPIDDDLNGDVRAQKNRLYCCNVCMR